MTRPGRSETRRFLDDTPRAVRDVPVPWVDELPEVPLHLRRRPPPLALHDDPVPEVEDVLLQAEELKGPLETSEREVQEVSPILAQQ